MSRVKNDWVFALLWVNLCMLLVALIQTAASNSWDFRSMLYAWAYCAAYANVTAIPAILLLPLLLERLVGYRRMQALAIIIGPLIFTALGCLIAQALLMWLRVDIPQHFWSTYLHTLRVALSMSLVFALGALFFASLRSRLHLAEEQLLNQEIATERSRKLLAEARLQLLESRIHPHFLFNTLNTISSLIPVTPLKAEKTVGQLATLLRAALDHSAQPLIPLHQELSMIDAYVEIEKARFGTKLRINIDVPERLYDVKVPPLSIQSLVENSVKHGLAPQRGDGELNVSAMLDNSYVRIEVSDTGSGFDLTTVPTGHGLDNLVARLDVLYGEAAGLKVLRRDDRCVVQIVIPT